MPGFNYHPCNYRANLSRFYILKKLNPSTKRSYPPFIPIPYGRKFSNRMHNGIHRTRRREETGQSDGQTAESSLTSCANCVAELTTRDNATLDRGVIGEPRQISRETGPEEFRGSAERGKRGGEKKTRRPFYCRSRPTPPPFSIRRKFTDQREFPRSSIYNETSNGFMIIGIIIVADKVERFHGSVEIYSFGEAKYRRGASCFSRR